MDKETTLRQRLPVYIAIILLFALLYGIAPYFIFEWFAPPDSAGTFGDSYGYVNAIVSSLALLAVAFTLWQQQKLLKQGQEMLEMQKEELKQNTAALNAQKDELKQQRQEMERQNEYLRGQEIESRFFRMLGLLKEALNDISKYASRSGYLALQDSIQVLKSNQNIRRSRHLLSHYSKELETMFNEKTSSNHYLRVISNLVHYLDQDNISTNRDLYFDVLRAQLSQAEQVFIFYYGLSTSGQLTKDGKPSFHSLAEKYLLLKDVSKGMLLDEYDMQYYPKHKEYFDSQARRGLQS